jgi:hypothetical protein
MGTVLLAGRVNGELAQGVKSAMGTVLLVGRANGERA